MEIILMTDDLGMDRNQCCQQEKFSTTQCKSGSIKNFAAGKNFWRIFIRFTKKKGWKGEGLF
jgi:hypothetical protein